LVGVDGVEDRLRIDLPGQRQLHEDAVDGRILVQAIDEREQLALCGRIRQLVLVGIHPGFPRLPALVLHIDLAGGVLAAPHDGQAGGEAVLRLQRAHLLRDAAAQTGRKGLAVDDLAVGGGRRVVHADVLNSSSQGSSACIRRAGSPCKWIILRRPEAPATTAKAAFGMPQALASSAITAALALPSSGAAVTATFSATPPSASGTKPSIRLRRALGRTRTHSRTPSEAMATGDSALPAATISSRVSCR